MDGGNNLDRKVIVLTPSEWENRIELGEAMQHGYNHTHYAVTKLAIIEALLYRFELGIDNEKLCKEELLSMVEKIKGITKNTEKEIRLAQRYVGNVAQLIGYKVNQEIQEGKDK